MLFSSKDFLFADGCQLHLSFKRPRLIASWTSDDILFVSVKISVDNKVLLQASTFRNIYCNKIVMFMRPHQIKQFVVLGIIDNVP